MSPAGFIAIFATWLLIPGAGMALLVRGLSWSKRDFLTHAIEASFVIAPCLLVVMVGGRFFLDVIFFEGLTNAWDWLVAFPVRVWWGAVVVLILESVVHSVRARRAA